MAELLKTSVQGRKNPHYHIAYIGDSGEGQTSIASGHSHLIQVVPTDMGDVPVVLDAEGHTHGLEEYVPAESKDTRTDTDKVEQVLRYYDEAERIESESRKAAYESESMYANQQWDPDTKQTLEDQDRAAVTINQIEGKIDSLSGYQRQHRTDIKYLPVEGGDGIVADMLNIVSKNIAEQTYYSREESKVFEDSSIVGRGLFHIFDDFSDDVRGQIVIEKFPWDECRFGPHAKEDLTDCDFIIKEKWFSEAAIKGEYPDKWEEFSPEVRLRPTGGTLISEDWDKRLRSDTFVDLVAKKYKVLECYTKEYSRTFILANAQDDFAFNATGWSAKDIASVKTIPGFVKIPRTTYKIRVYKVCSYVLLDEWEHDEQDFPIIPLYAKFRNGRFWGKIECAKDLQHLINKAYSQFIDIINKVANYGWFYDDQTFPDEKERKLWLANASSPGFNQKVTNAKEPPVKTEGVKFPGELVTAIDMFSKSMREIVNVNLEMLGEGTQQSGIAMQQKITQQLVGNDYLFDNLSFVKKKIGRMIVRKIKKLYTPDRLMRLLVSQYNRQAFEVAGQDFGEFNPDEIRTVLETADLEKFDVEVSESPSSPSAMMGNFMMLLELAGKGIAIPPAAILEFAPIPNKERVLKLIAEQMQMQQAQEQQTHDTEIAKTMIAHPPEGEMPGQGQ